MPKRLLKFMQRDGIVRNMVLRIYMPVIARSTSDQCSGAAHVAEAALHSGAEAFIHRFESSLNGDVQCSVCVVDGVFEELVGAVFYGALAQSGQYAVEPLCQPEIQMCFGAGVRASHAQNQLAAPASQLF